MAKQLIGIIVAGPSQMLPDTLLRPGSAARMGGMDFRFRLRQLLWTPVIVAAAAVLSPLMPPTFTNNPRPLFLFVSGGCLALFVWTLVTRTRE
jgi:hypothetical protein